MFCKTRCLRCVLGVVAMVAAGFASPALSETVWNFTADWADVNQSGSVWKTGFLLDDAGNFNQLPTFNYTAPGERWDNYGDPDTYGCTNKNTSSGAYENWGMYWEPGQTTIMPGYGAWISARFIAPVSAQYMITARWTNQRTDGREVDVRLLRGREGSETVWDATLWIDTLNGFIGRAVNGYQDATGTHQSATYSTTLSLDAGKVLDFVAAPKASYQYSTTGIEITITQVPEPGTIALLASGLLGLLAYAWRKRK